MNSEWPQHGTRHMHKTIGGLKFSAHKTSMRFPDTCVQTDITKVIPSGESVKTYSVKTRGNERIILRLVCTTIVAVEKK